MIAYYISHSAREGLHHVLTPPATNAWVYGRDVTIPETEKLSAQYGLDDSIVSDIHDKHELPRVEYGTGGTMYLFVRSVERNTLGEVKTAPLLAIANGKQYFTLSPASYLQPEDIIPQLEQRKTADGSVLLLLTLNTLLITYERFLRHTAQSIDDIGHRLRSHEVENKDFLKFITIDENLNTYQTNLSATQAVLERLKDNRHNMFGVRQLEVIDDLILHIRQMLVSVSSNTQRVASMRSTYTTIANNNLNQRIKTLTVLTILITLPNVIFGMYGMNVALPFMEQGWVFPMIIAATVLVVLGVYITVRRKKIL